MVSWKKIHEWMVKALEEPFFRAEMHRVDMSLPEKIERKLRVVGGGKNKAANSFEPVERGRVKNISGRA